jgi:hypothetical protein
VVCMKQAVYVLFWALTLISFDVRGQSIATDYSENIPVKTILFAQTPAPSYGKLVWETSNLFTRGTAVYGMAFFQQKLGTLGIDDRGCVDLWIDGLFVKRYLFTNRDVSASSLRMRLYVAQTGKDDFDARFFSSLLKGDHRIRIVVGVEKSNGENVQKSYSILAEGTFVLAVQ